MSSPKPFNVVDSVAFSQSEVERMRSLLREARLPSDNIVPDAEWDYGIPLDYLKELKRFWLEDWDFESLIKQLSSFKHYTVEIEGIDLHFIHEVSSNTDAVPLLLSHGWPGSFYEFNKVIRPLTSPTSAGDLAFNVVVPSLPGYGFSGPPPKKGWTLLDTARVFNKLMVDVLGYKEYAAQGGDWGFVILRALAGNHGENCVLVHFNNLVALPPIVHYPFLIAWKFLPSVIGEYIGSFAVDAGDLRRLKRQEEFRETGIGYFHIQRTKPATIGYALYDSPLGLLSYIGEKYHDWVDPNYPLPPKDIVDTVALYFLTHSFHTSTLPYYESSHLFLKLPKQKHGKAAMSTFGWDILGAPTNWANAHVNLTFSKLHEQGGHFPALETPDVLVADLREFAAESWKA